MIKICPKCSSSRIATKNFASKTGGTIGLVAGSFVGATSMAGGAEAGAAIGSFAGPLGVVAGSLTGAIIGGLLGGSAGALTGMEVGKAIDDNLLNDCICLDCKHTFNQRECFALLQDAEPE